MDTSRQRSRRRILVVANETVESRLLHESIRTDAGGLGIAEILVVAPALNSRVRHWISDEDEARRAAETRLLRSLERLAEAGLKAGG